MTTVGETKSQFLPSFSFYQAPSLAQRVDYLRSPGKLSDLSSLRCEFVVLSGEHIATSKCADVPAQLWPDTDDEWWEDDRGDSRSGEAISCISSHLEELPLAEYESDPFCSSDACPDDTKEIEPVAADHRDSRDPSWSAGAISHDAGDCRPCAWNWKRSGCVKGIACEFCHMCNEGIVKLRKKEKLASLKHARASKKETKAIATLVVPLPIGLVRKSNEEQGGGANTPSTSAEPSIASPAASEGNMVSCI